MIYEVSVPIAFGAGLVSFFAPCVIPLLPAYVGYITGVSFDELKKDKHHRYRKKILFSSLSYILGFSLLFVLAGTAAASISALFVSYRDLILKLGGVVIIILGMQFAGYLNFSSLSKERKFSLPGWADNLGYFRSFLVGIIFAAAWSPCVGVVYGAILSLAAVSGTAARGAGLLLVYSLGISIPFLVVSMTLASSPRYLKRINKHIGKIIKISGIILVILGVLMFTNTYRYINSWLLDFGFGLGYKAR